MISVPIGGYFITVNTVFRGSLIISLVLVTESVSGPC